MNERPRAFFFHFNKPASTAAGYPVMSVHQSGQCHLVAHVDCRVPTRSRISSRRQPRVVMAGRGRVAIEDNRAVITP